MFGVRWTYEPAVRGSMVVPGDPMLDEIDQWRDKIRIPDLEEIDWEAVRARCEPLIDPDRLTGTMVFSGFFERLISLLDFENAAMTLIDEDYEEDIRSLFTMLSDYYVALFGKLRTYCGIDIVTFHDDWGHQLSSFFSPDTCRDLILPYMKRIVDACHTNGMIFDLHSCGKVEKLVPLMAEAGIDKWDGQTINDLWSLVDDLGDRICITLNEKKPDMTPAEADAWAAGILSHLSSSKAVCIPMRGLGPAAREALLRRSMEFYS